MSDLRELIAKAEASGKVVVLRYDPGGPWYAAIDNHSYIEGEHGFDTLEEALAKAIEEVEGIA